MKTILLSIVFCSLSIAQTINITDVQGVAKAAATTQPILQTITGVDGTKCYLVKQPSSTIYAGFACFSSDNLVTTKTVQIQSTGTVSNIEVLGQGQVLCMMGINPTTVIVSFGSVGNAPAKGIAWSCANGDGSTILTGTALWP